LIGSARTGACDHAARLTHAARPVPRFRQQRPEGCLIATISDPVQWAAIIVTRSRNSYLSHLAWLLAATATPPQFDIELDARTAHMLMSQLRIRGPALRRLLDVLTTTGYLTMTVPPATGSYGQYRLGLPSTETSPDTEASTMPPPASPPIADDNTDRTDFDLQG
jgi:hypothetical protein